MTIRTALSLALLAVLAACDKAPPPEAGNMQAPAPVAMNELMAGNVAAPPAEADGKTAEAALALAREHYALVEAKRFAEAARLVRNGDARKLADKFGKYRALRVSAGPAGKMEGAAGSIYVTVPATIEAMSADGTATTIREIVTLRRVNDVPGSTPAQRRWHIEGVDAAATNDRRP